MEGAGRDTGELYGTGFDYVTWGALSCAAAAGKLSDQLRSERAHSLVEKIEVEEDPELNEYVRENDDSVPMDVTVETGEGSYRTRVDYPPGHATRPMSDERLEGKFSGMALELLTEEQVERTLDACYDLDSLDSVEPLVDDLIV